MYMATGSLWKIEAPKSRGDNQILSDNLLITTHWKHIRSTKDLEKQNRKYQFQWVFEVLLSTEAELFGEWNWDLEKNCEKCSDWKYDYKILHGNKSVHG